MAWLWEADNWTNFRFDSSLYSSELAAQEDLRQAIITRMSVFGREDRASLGLEGRCGEVLSTSEIEGEPMGLEAVRSSLARRMGVDIGALLPADARVEGMVELVLDATGSYDRPLDNERLFAWHRLLFPYGRSGIHRIESGSWRSDSEGPMRVISGPMGRETEHFRAPPAERLPREMALFLDWFEGPSTGPQGEALDPVLKSAIAHLRFVTIHPFEDGNGRIARAIADRQLARAEDSSERWYSMAAAIRRDRKRYYDLLESTQRGSGDIGDWLSWYLACRRNALNTANGRLEHSARVFRLRARASRLALNRRQRHLLDLLTGDFVGKLTSSKWALLGKCSQDSASRDINSLVAAGLLKKSEAGGRSTSYELVWDD